MAKKTAPLLPSTDELLRKLGDRLRLARQRRRLSAKQVAERAGMSPMTLRSLERGGSGVTIGAYLAVMQVLGIEQDLNLLGQADPAGRELQDARLSARSKTSARMRPLQTTKSPTLQKRPASKDAATQIKQLKQPENVAKQAKQFKEMGFASSKDLADLLDAASSSAKTKRR